MKNNLVFTATYNEVENIVNLVEKVFEYSPKVLDYIEGDQTIWEEAPMENLSHEGNMIAFEHEDFWQSMDTLRDKMYLEELWASGDAPWKVWK